MRWAHYVPHAPNCADNAARMARVLGQPTSRAGRNARSEWGHLVSAVGKAELVAVTAAEGVDSAVLR